MVVGNPGGKETLTLRIEPNGPAEPGAVGAGFQEVIKLRPVVVTLGPGETIPEGAPALVDERTYD